MIVRTAVSSELLNRDTRKGGLEESMSGGGMKVLVFTEMCSVLTSLMLANLAVTCIWK